MQESTRGNGQPADSGDPSDSQSDPHMVEDINAVARRVPTADVASAALRSMLIGAVLVGGLTWLARVVLHRRRKARGRND
jgi:hypothetical protein